MAIERIEIEYTGHAGDGGLQRHSIGDQYPWTVQGIGNGAKVEWQPFNTCTAEVGPKFATQGAATGWIDATIRARAELALNPPDEIVVKGVLGVLEQQLESGEWEPVEVYVPPQGVARVSGVQWLGAAA